MHLSFAVNMNFLMASTAGRLTTLCLQGKLERSEAGGIGFKFIPAPARIAVSISGRKLHSFMSPSSHGILRFFPQVSKSNPISCDLDHAITAFPSTIPS